MIKLPENLKVGMRLHVSNPVFASNSEVVEIAKIDHHGIWLMRENGVMIRNPVTRSQLVAYDYELITKEGGKNEKPKTITDA